MVQSDANCSLQSNSLIIREKTGNFRDFGCLGVDLQLKKPHLLSGFCRNSLLNRTGNYFRVTGNLIGVSGNFLRRTEKLLIRSVEPAGRQCQSYEASRDRGRLAGSPETISRPYRYLTSPRRRPRSKIPVRTRPMPIFMRSTTLLWFRTDPYFPPRRFHRSAMS